MTLALQITAHLAGYEDLVATSRVVAIRPAHRVPRADARKLVRVVVTVAKAGYITQSKASQPVRVH